MHKFLKQSVDFVGVGLHGGARVRMSVLPARPGAGVVFRRTDVAPDIADVPARYDLVSDTMLCTRLSNEHGVSIGTVEHLMAALAGCGITDALVLLNGPEVPIMDGSAVGFVSAFARAGIGRSDAPLRAIHVLEPVEIRDGDKLARLEPADRFSAEFRIDFNDPAIGRQELALELTGCAFAEELADCRTFGHLAEVEQLRKMGLAKGGGLENAIVVDRGRVLNPGGLRREDEFVRHKLLDAVGDLALAGAPIVGRYVGERAGHGMTNRLLRALFARPSAWEWVELSEEAGLGGAISLPERAKLASAAAS